MTYPSKDEVVTIVAQAISDGGDASKIVDALVSSGALKLRAKRSNAEIDAVVEVFKKAFGTTKSTGYDRYAANRLIKKHGVQRIVDLIQLLRDNMDNKYCPMPSSLAQMEDKWISIVRFEKSVEEDNIEI